MQSKTSTPNRPPKQFALPGIEFAPPKVRSHGLREAHTYPLVSRGKRNGVHGSSFRVPASVAWNYPEIELRTGNSAPCIVLDLDGATALERCLWLVDHGKVREPNWMVTRRDGGGTHVVYTLERPVLSGPDMRAAPIRLLGPQGSPQNRPTKVTSKPANEGGPGPGCFTATCRDRASLFWYANSVGHT